MIRKWRNRKEIPTPQTEGWEKKQKRPYTKKTYCKPSERLFPNRRPLSYSNLTKNRKAYIRLKQHKNSTAKNKTIRTTTEVPPWNNQEYKITGWLKLVLQAPNLPLIFCSGSQHLVSCSVLCGEPLTSQ